jgi:hypothetical protein
MVFSDLFDPNSDNSKILNNVSIFSQNNLLENENEFDQNPTKFDSNQNNLFNSEKFDSTVIKN